MLRVSKRLSPSIRVRIMVDYLLMCFISWQSVVKKVAHFVLLMSIYPNNITFNTTVSFVEHVIVVFVVLIVRM